MSKNIVNGINAATVIFCIISVVGIFYLILRWKLNRKLRKQVRVMLPSLHAVLGVYNGLTDYTNYFSNFQAGVFLAKAKSLYARLPFSVESVGLEDDELELITKLNDIIRKLPDLRNAYNDEFVPMEIEKYLAFFSGLEKYPLSLEQMEAVVSDEDSNLVIAGAGTGKTTTVSAKVAYVLEKGLAEPEDLLIISFTRSAVSEMFDRCVKFCGRDFGDVELEVKTINAFGWINQSTLIPSRRK